ncbi:conserved hypothetical protein [Frankia sp. Hr75.2]|nr:conserved hypothetical protein [Frankia sp. Hr75.2]
MPDIFWSADRRRRWRLIRIKLPDDGELDRRVRSVDPVRADLASRDDVARLVSELARAVVRTGSADEAGPDGMTEWPARSGQPHRPGLMSVRAPGDRSARRRVVVAGLAAAALLGTAAFTFGDELAARTGLFGSPGMTENDTSEWLNTGASDFREVMESLRPADIPLPAGRSWQPVIDQTVANGQREAALMQVTGVRAAFAWYAICVWDGEWLAARGTGDSARAGRAVGVMRGMPSWPIIVAVDGGGVTDSLHDIAEAAARGDEGPARQHITANCGSEWIGTDQ